jgi:Cu-processing system permease protein
LTRKAAAASGAALILWLALVFVADLGVMGAALAWRPSPSELLWLLVINPLQIFKLGAIHSLHASLDTLGPVGQYALHRFGERLPLLLTGLLTLWATAAFATAFVIFNRKGEG